MNTKISVFTIFVGFALLFAGCSKDDENIPGGIEPPKTILDAFNAKYPDARDTEWTVNDDYYVIDFENNSLDNTAWFDHLGVWAMIKTDLPLNQLPTAISNDIKQGKYAGWKIEEADTIGRAGMGTVYKVEVEKAEQETDLYYTLYGDLIKAVDNAKDDVDRPISVPEKPDGTDLPGSRVAGYRKHDFRCTVGNPRREDFKDCRINPDIYMEKYDLESFRAGSPDSYHGCIQGFRIRK